MRRGYTRSKNDPNRHRLAKAFMTHNMKGKSVADQQKDFELGVKTETGTLESVGDIIRAVSIIDELVLEGRIDKSDAVELKINLAEKMAGFKIVPK